MHTGQVVVKVIITYAILLASCGGRTAGGGPGPADGSGPADGKALDSGSVVDGQNADETAVPDGSSSRADSATVDTGLRDAGDDSTLSEHDGSLDGGADVQTDSTVITFDGSPGDGLDAAPPVGSPACDDEPCILCNDGNYHCHTSVYPQCQIGITTSRSCMMYNLPSYGCFTCSAEGTGYLWQCTAETWALTSFACTP
jgi:hypothetical protein